MFSELLDEIASLTREVNESLKREMDLRGRVEEAAKDLNKSLKMEVELRTSRWLVVFSCLFVYIRTVICKSRNSKISG